ARFEYRQASGIALRGAAFADSGDPDVVVVTLSDLPSEGRNLRCRFESLRCTFPDRSVLATLTQAAACDIFQVLVMGASDFVLPPLRRSELLPRLMRQARVTPRGNVLVENLKEEIGLKQIVGQSPAIL